MALKDDFSWIRGANYIPSNGANNVQVWKKFDAAAVDRELGFAEKMDLNSVRVNLPYIIYEHQRERFLKDVKTFVELCGKHGIRPMICLFDGCFGIQPSLDSAELWVASPGPDRTSPAFYPAGEKYVKDVIDLFRDDPRVLMWDVMNEPMSTYHTPTDEWVRQIWDFVRHFCDYVHSIDGFHPITVGIGGIDNSEIVDHVDVLSMHSYNKDPQAFRDEIAKVRADAQKAGKPFLISECCAPGWGQPYEMAMPIVREEKVGFYVWEVMIAKSQFTPIAGLFYPDGTVRRIAHVEAVAGRPVPGLVEKPDSEGVPISSGPSMGKTVLPMLDRMLATPIDEERYRERITAMEVMVFAGALGPQVGAVSEGVAEVRRLEADGKLDEAFRRTDELLKVARKGLVAFLEAQAAQHPESDEMVGFHAPEAERGGQ